MATDRIYSDTPHHPGEHLRDTLEALEMTQRALADAVGRPVRVINEIVNGRRNMTAELALLLEHAVPGISAESWMALQHHYEMTKARQAMAEKAG